MKGLRVKQRGEVDLRKDSYGWPMMHLARWYSACQLVFVVVSMVMLNIP